MNHYFPTQSLNLHPAIRFAITSAFTLLATVMLVQSSAQPVIGPAAPPGPPDLAREIVLTFGHIGTFSVLVSLWTWTLTTTLPFRRALFVAVGFALIYGGITELAQSLVPDREVSLYDLLVNWSVTLLARWLILKFHRGMTT